MNLKDKRIPIPEVPSEWTQVSISGSTHIWRSKFHAVDSAELTLKAPEKGLIAKRGADGWYWVCGCGKCMGTNSYNYHPCEAHDRCEDCSATRAELTETPWHTGSGWHCKPCRDRQRAAAKAEALAAAEAKGFDEHDHQDADSILCPYCASEHSTDDLYESREALTCGVCDGVFDLEIDWSPSYTTSKADPKTTTESQNQ